MSKFLRTLATGTTIKFLKLAVSPSLNTFNAHLETPQKAQSVVLQKILKELSDSEYGKKLNVTRDLNYNTFAKLLPLVAYEELEPWVTQGFQKGQCTLSSSKFIRHNATSGSSGAIKRIPYTRGLQESFQHMFVLWLADILKNGPQFKSAKICMSLSPQTSDSIEHDLEYLQPWFQRLLNQFLVLPPGLSRIKDPDLFRHAVSLHLLVEADLEIVSVWNPSWLEVLLQYIESERHRLLKDIDNGRFSSREFSFELPKISTDRRELLLRNKVPWQELWSNLSFISCWGSAYAKPTLDRLSEHFPEALVQPKGLLLTETPVSIPLIPSGGLVPLVDRVLLEFEDSSGEVLPLHKVKQGETYSLITSTPGGFVRYRTFDRVKVTHFTRNTPCFDFVGRESSVCDLVGEKLNVEYLTRAFSQLSYLPKFHLLLPCTREIKPKYILVCSELMSGYPIAQKLEELLCTSLHYGRARALNQLGAIEALVDPLAEKKFLEFYLQKGMRLGDIKPINLISNVHDAEALREFLQAKPCSYFAN